MAGLAFEELACAMADDPVLGRITARAVKAARPASRLEGLCALVFGAEALDEFRQRHALLELDGVERHGLGSESGYRQGYRPGGSPEEPPEATYQSGSEMSSV